MTELVDLHLDGGVSIYENFLTLKAEKQNRILDAAYREFGRYGYKKTSAEQIARSAGIAKGMIFHYFGSKQGMYEYLVEHARRVFSDSYGGLEEMIKELDYIEQYRHLTKVKLSSYMRNPAVYEFYTMLFTQPENLEISEKVGVLYSETMGIRHKILSAVQNSGNVGLFRSDIDRDKAKRYITWMINGYSQELLAMVYKTPLADMDIDKYRGEFDRMLDDLKKLFYKAE